MERGARVVRWNRPRGGAAERGTRVVRWKRPRAPLSKTKIAELLRVSRERVRQIEVRALGKLRSHVREPRAA